MCLSIFVAVFNRHTVKFRKYGPGAYIFQRLFLRGLTTEGNLRFKIDWASLIVRRKFTVIALLYYVFEGNFQVHPPRGGLYLEGRFNGGFFAFRVWGAYIWRGLYMKGFIFGILRYLQSWTKVLGTVLQYSYFSVISRSPLKAVHPFRNFLAVLPPPPPHPIQS